MPDWVYGCCGRSWPAYYGLGALRSTLSRRLNRLIGRDGSLVILKLLIGINLRAYAMARYATIEERVEEDRRNDRSRPTIGTNVSENVGLESKAVASVLMLFPYCKAARDRDEETAGAEGLRFAWQVHWPNRQLDREQYDNGDFVALLHDQEPDILACREG